MTWSEVVKISPKHGLHALTALPRSIHLHVSSWDSKMNTVSTFRPSNNNKWRWCVYGRPSSIQAAGLVAISETMSVPSELLNDYSTTDIGTGIVLLLLGRIAVLRTYTCGPFLQTGVACVTMMLYR